MGNRGRKKERERDKERSDRCERKEKEETISSRISLRNKNALNGHIIYTMVKVEVKIMESG